MRGDSLHDQTALLHGRLQVLREKGVEGVRKRADDGGAARRVGRFLQDGRLVSSDVLESGGACGLCVCPDGEDAEREDEIVDGIGSPKHRAFGGGRQGKHRSASFGRYPEGSVHGEAMSSAMVARSHGATCSIESITARGSAG
eukprot:5085465-Pleurochrysis_carterae.AAC.1